MGDYCAVQFLSKTKVDVPLVYHTKTIATDMTNSIYPVLEKLYEITGVKPVIAYERNAGGVFEIDRLASMNYGGKYEIFKMPNVGRDNPPESVRYGWDTNSSTRPAMLSQLKDAIDNKVLRIYDKQTISEMYSFVITQTSSSWKAQAESGAHDDLVMSLAIAWQMYQICQPQKIQPPGEYPKMDYFHEGYY
jgi:hypothetical protein